jgi:hypothetical protein
MHEQPDTEQYDQVKRIELAVTQGAKHWCEPYKKDAVGAYQFPVFSYTSHNLTYHLLGRGALIHLDE